MHQGIYTKGEIAKIGNAIIYFAERIKPLPKTKLLKVLYFLEEASVKKWGSPFLGLKFDVWHLGPVARDIFVELSSEPVLLGEYIQCVEDGDSRIVVPKCPFSDDEFSDNEIDLLNLVVESYGHLTGNQLIRLTHNKHSLWYHTAQRHQVLSYLEQGRQTTTDFSIDFTDLLEEEPEKKAFYQECLEFNHLRNGQIITCKFDMLSFHPDDPSF